MSLYYDKPIPQSERAKSVRRASRASSCAFFDMALYCDGPIGNSSSQISCAIKAPVSGAPSNCLMPSPTLSVKKELEEYVEEYELGAALARDPHG